MGDVTGMTVQTPAMPRTPNQIAALPVRLHAEGFVEVLLVTSRETGRWIIPQGWLAPGLAPHEAAAKEAMEEAGVVGAIAPEPIGHFDYDKRLDSGVVLPCQVAVYLLRVERQLDRWREKGRRDHEWVTSREAARRVCNLSLQRLIARIGRSPELASPTPLRAVRNRRSPSSLSVA